MEIENTRNPSVYSIGKRKDKRKNMSQLGVVAHTCNLSQQRITREFQAGLGYRIRDCLRKGRRKIIRGGKERGRKRKDVEEEDKERGRGGRGRNGGGGASCPNQTAENPSKPSKDNRHKETALQDAPPTAAEDRSFLREYGNLSK